MKTNALFKGELKFYQALAKIWDKYLDNFLVKAFVVCLYGGVFLLFVISIILAK